ncbi:MAG: glycosyltransferase family 39 protein [Lentisphaeria bacterium]|nr:glycosyltransferase family 39 protein [Lentisphaeria bacterium]
MLITLSGSKKIIFAGIIAVSILLAAGGITIFCCAAKSAQIIGKNSWDAPVFYESQLLFIGRVFLAAALIGNTGLLLYRKNGDIVKTLTICAIATGVFLQLDSYIRRDFWNDTMALAAWLKYSTWELFLPGYSNFAMQAAPPGFIFLSKLIGDVIGYNKWILTLPALLFALGSIWQFDKLSAKILSPTGHLAAIWLFCLNPGVWLYAGEFKQYSADIFFTVLIISRSIDFCNDGKKYWKQLSFTGVAAVLFSHAMFFIMPAAGAALLYHHLFRQRNNWCFAAGAIWFTAVTAAAIYAKAVMPSGMYIHEHHIAGFAPAPDSWNNIKWYLLNFTAAFSAPWNMSRGIILSLFPIAGMIYGIRKNLISKIPLPAVTGIVTLIMLYIAAALHQYSFAPGLPFAKCRLILFTIPVATLIFGFSIKGKISLLWIIPVFFSAIFNCCTAFMPIGNFSPPVQELISRTRAGDKILISTDAARWALMLYAPKNYFTGFEKFDINSPSDIRCEADRIHFFFVDCPSEQWSAPDGYVIEKRSNFTLSSVITVKKSTFDTPADK